MKSKTIISLSPSQLAKVCAFARENGIRDSDALQLIVNMGVKHLSSLDLTAMEECAKNLKKHGCLTPLKRLAAGTGSVRKNAAKEKHARRLKYDGNKGI